METAAHVFLLLLAFVVAFALLARKLRTPYPIVLVLAGLALSLVPGTPRVELDPDLVFSVVLPPLLYAAAWTASWREFRHSVVSIISVVVGLVLFTIVGVALAAHWLLPALTWPLGIILGAIVAPTDPTAATAIASQIGLPRRIVDLLEDESLLNDATGLVALGFGMSLVLTGASPTVGSVVVRFVYLVLAGLAAGAAVAWVVAWVERRIDDGPIEIAISIMVPYTAYVCAEFIGASGILSVVASGLALSRRSAEIFSPPVRLQVYAVWTSVVFILNGLVFVLIGLQLPQIVPQLAGAGAARLILEGGMFSALVVALRLAWVGPGARASYFVRRRLLHQTEPVPTWRELLVFAWSGMRGVVSLAAALSIPTTMPGGTPFPQRNLIVFLAFCVVVSTLVLQGLTLAPLTRALGLADGPGPACEEQEARRIAIQSALAHLEAARQHDRAEFAAVYDDLAQHYRERLQAVSDPPDSDGREGVREYRRYRELSRELLRVQRRALEGLRRDDRIDDHVLRDLERDLDLQESRESRRAGGG